MKGNSTQEIGNISEPGNWINVKARVLQLWNPNSDVISQVGLLGDETGRMRFVAWKKSELPLLKEGGNYLIKGVVVDEWNDRLQLNLNKNSKIIELDEDVKIDRKVKGTVEKIVPKSGYIERCPECKRVLVDKDICVVHGEVKGIPDLRIKASLGDKIYLLNGKIAEEVLGISTERAKDLPKEEIMNRIHKKVKNKKFRFEGKDMGKNFLVKRFERFYV